MDGEELLWELAGMEAEWEGADVVGAGRELPEAALEEYRSGGMAAPESNRLEAALIGSRRERRRLEALAGVHLPAPASVRRRLFGDAGGAVEDRPRVGRREARWYLPVAASAAAIAVLGLVGLWQAGERGALPGIHPRPLLPPPPP